MMTFRQQVERAAFPKYLKDALIRYDAKHPGRLQEISDERNTPGVWSKSGDCNGVWIYLCQGWHCADMGGEVHCVHEWSGKDLLRALKSVEVCDCESCKQFTQPCERRTAER